MSAVGRLWPQQAVGVVDQAHAFQPARDSESAGRARQQTCAIKVPSEVMTGFLLSQTHSAGLSQRPVVCSAAERVASRARARVRVGVRSESGAVEVSPVELVELLGDVETDEHIGNREPRRQPARPRMAHVEDWPERVVLRTVTETRVVRLVT